MRRITFVTNFCPFYRIRLFEKLSTIYEMVFLFYSEGKEWYWQKSHGVETGNFSSKYLPGFWLGKTRIALSLPLELISGKYEIIIKCINGKFTLPITFLIAKILRRPFILYTGIWTRLSTLSHRFIFPMTNFIYHHSDAIVVYGQHVKQYLISESVPAEKVFVAPHAVDNDVYQIPANKENQAAIRTSLNIPDEKKVILFLGRLEAIKGIETLIEAFAALNRNDTILVIAGDGSLMDDLNALVNELNLQESVRFAGYVNRKDTIDYYDVADIFVLPSVTLPAGKELWGLTVNEVFNRGKAVIASNAVGAAAGGLIEHEVNGLIFEERNIPALSEALIELLDNDEKRKMFGKNAFSKINQWDINKMADGFIQAIEFVSKQAL